MGVVVVVQVQSPVKVGLGLVCAAVRDDEFLGQQDAAVQLLSALGGARILEPLR